MKTAWRGPLLSATFLLLTGCDWEALQRASRPPDEPVPCTAALVAIGRTQLYFKLGPIANRRVELFINEAPIWSSERPDEPKGWAHYHNGVLRYMSFEDFEELRLEERDPDGVLLRAPLALKLLNGGEPNAPNACGAAPPPRPPQLYFEYLAENP